MTQEEHQLWRFIEIAEVEGDLEFSDSPDLLVRRSGYTVGIEHTRLLQPKEPGKDIRAFESVMKRAVAQAQEAHDATDPGELWVGVHPNTRIRLTSRDRDSIAEDLEAVVRLVKPTTQGDVRAEGWRFRKDGLPFPKGVHSIMVARLPGIKRSVWYPSWAFFVPRLKPQDVAERIASKDARVPTYRARCDEVWLVLAIENFSASGAWDLDDFPFDHPYDTDFDRLFLHHVFSAHVHELRRVP